MMRITMAVQGGKAGGGQRLVDRRPVGDPWIALRRRPRMTRQPGCETLFQQAAIGRAAAMMDQPGDDADVKVAQPPQPFVGPLPVALVRMARAERKSGVWGRGVVEGREY